MLDTSLMERRLAVIALQSGLILSDMVRTISMEEEPWERQLPPSGTSMFIDTEPPASVRERRY
jgi:hypothetical protein